MATEPSGVSVFSPKIRDQSLVRRFVSQNGRGYVALDIRTANESIDPDEGSLALKIWFNDTTTQTPVTDDPRGVLVAEVAQDDLDHEDTGKFAYEVGPEHTTQRGALTIEWAYQVGGVDFSFTDYLQILGQMPLYDSLTDKERLNIEQVSWMIGDLFDSTEGGPYLIEPFQTHFDYERITQLAQVAVTRLNTMAFPVTGWVFGTQGNSVPAKFSPLLTLGIYYEVVRHLIRSYVEIPNKMGLNVTYLDRRDYMQRWEQVLAREWPEYQHMVKLAKRDLLNLGRGALLVAGGLYGGGANGIFVPGQYSASVRAFRFYPAAPAVSFGGII